MKKIVLFFFVIISIFLLLSYFNRQSVNNVDVLSPEPELTIMPSIIMKNNQELKKSIFVPYWTINKNLDLEEFDEVIYFGITANKEGIDKEDPGYKSMDKFLNDMDKNKKKFLTIRLTNSQINSEILINSTLQKKIINESINITKNNNFNGVVLDFEIASLYFESVVKNINSFTKNFYEYTKSNNLEFYVTVYGDNFYRLRPFDIATLSNNADKIMIMAYDFHKSKGNPGPNFSYEGKEVYGYDFKTMIEDFSKKVSKEKIIVIFGLFGYDWVVDNKGASTKNGVPLSTNEVEKTFIEKCKYKNCLSQKDKISLGTKISYEDLDDNSHIIWIETLDSVSKKIEYLKNNNINSVSYWAYSYF